MKTKNKLEPRVAAKLKQRAVLVFAGVGLAIATIVGVISFLYLNLGRQEDALAVTYFNSSDTGTWTNDDNWNGNAPGTTNVQTSGITVNSHYITRNGDLSFGKEVTLTVNSNGTLEIIGDLTIGKDFIMYINGTLIVRGALNVDKDAAFTANGEGNIIVYGPASLGKDATFQVNGVMDFKDDLSFEKDAVVNINGSGIINVGNNLTFDEGADITNNGIINVANDLIFNDDPDFFTGSGTVNMGNNACDYWQGTGTCNENTVLPVELLSFTANTEGNTVNIQWQTASELNNDYFTIERSSNGIDFKSIAEIKGNGTTKDISGYTYSDSKPLQGLSYYRLKQTDFDGTTEIFRPVSVNVNSHAENKVDIYPNPLLGSTLKLRMESPEEGSVEILNQNGTMVFNKSLEGFSSEEEMEMPGNLRAGIYFVNVKTASVQKSFKLIKR